MIDAHEPMITLTLESFGCCPTCRLLDGYLVDPDTEVIAAAQAVAK
jgi:hypothetical protein